MDKLRALATLSTDDLVEGLQRNPHVASDVWRNLSDVDLGAGNAIAREAFALLDAGAPEVSGEIRSLLEEVVFANGDADERSLFMASPRFAFGVPS